MDVNVSGKLGKTEMACYFITEERAKDIKAGKAAVPKPIKELIKAGDFSGKDDQAEKITGDGISKRILVIGLGKTKDVDTETIRKVSCEAAREGSTLKLKEMTIVADAKVNDAVAAVAEGAILGVYKFDKYKEKKKDKVKLLNIVSGSASAKQEAQRAKTIAEGTNMAREWVNEVSDVLNPVAVAELAVKLGKQHGFGVKVLDEKQLKKLGMNLFLGVAAGSRFPARLVLLEYKGSKDKPVAIVGKGVTFDSGGLNLKPSGFIETMKMDKGGAMTILATVVTLARLKAKVNVIGAMGMVENMIGPNATKPGDIIKGYSGKTVEIGDTDAEGRLVLADTLAYLSKNYKPKLMVDLATLTGSVLITFGEYVAASMGTDKGAADGLFKAGQRTYERVWELPLYKEYDEEMKGTISDITNLGYKQGRYAGSITAGAFLKKFVGKTPWVHIDIAGTAWYEKPRGYIPVGATGFGVRLLTEFLTAKG
ncbi:MAG: leucyl aminopeptidase [Candidatus Aenigmatarchaeota archaeon]